MANKLCSYRDKILREIDSYPFMTEYDIKLYKREKDCKKFVDKLNDFFNKIIRIQISKEKNKYNDPEQVKELNKLYDDILKRKITPSKFFEKFKEFEHDNLEEILVILATLVTAGKSRLMDKNDSRSYIYIKNELLRTNRHDLPKRINEIFDDIVLNFKELRKKVQNPITSLYFPIIGKYKNHLIILFLNKKMNDAGLFGSKKGKSKSRGH